jgi:exosortase A-associated hydrolase 1
MRQLLSFACEGCTLGASLDTAEGGTGLLIVTGGSQTRIGSHRMFERLAVGVAAAGYPCFRFDRRGIGDSEGEDPGFRGNKPDLSAAAAAFRAESEIERVIGLGLCDGATSLTLFGKEAGLDALILVNPWLVESEAGAPAAAAIKHHYRRQLLTPGGWKRVITGAISYRKLFKGILKIITFRKSLLANDVAAALAASKLPVELIFARDDATAVAASDVWGSTSFAARVRSLPAHLTLIETDSHTFSRPGDAAELLAACLGALERLSLGRG